MTDAYETPVSPEELEIGDSGPEVVVEDLERRDFVKYAGASGDFNPIHYDEPYATEAGNPSVFAQGMLTAGFGAHMAADWFGLGNITYYGVRFQARVFPEDTITVQGEITDIDHSGNETIVDADISAVNQDDDVVLTGSVTASL